jgi:hypothetical protein
VGLRVTIKPPDDVQAAEDAAKAFVRGFARIVIGQLRAAEQNETEKLNLPEDDVRAA